MPHVPRGAPAGSGPRGRACSTPGCILQVHATKACSVPPEARATAPPSKVDLGCERLCCNVGHAVQPPRLVSGGVADGEEVPYAYAGGRGR